jgi:hypothetical protein
VSGKMAPQRDRSSLIEKDSHLPSAQAATTSRLCSARCSTASTCSRVTPGNHSRKSSTRAPPCRFSKSALTGTRVPLKTQAPLTLPGFRSTAGQWLQSIINENLPPRGLASKPRCQPFCGFDAKLDQNYACLDARPKGWPSAISTCVSAMLSQFKSTPNKPTGE